MSILGRVFWVRHGPTHAKSMVGWSDIPADLSDTARIARLDAFLPRDSVVISSDLIRAVATADAIAGDRHRLQHDPNLREIHFGDWEMQNVDTIEDQEKLRTVSEKIFYQSIDGYDSNYNDLKERINKLNTSFATDGNYIFYLSTPPRVYKTISQRLRRI